MTSVRPKVVVVASGKGGVGKTLLAACLGAVASDTAKWRVLLADVDFSVKGLTFLYGGPGDWTDCGGGMIDVLHGNRSPKEAIAGAKRVNGVRIIPAVMSFDEKLHADLSDSERSRVVTLWGEFVASARDAGFDLIVFDTGAGVDQMVLTLARHASDILVVVEPDEISLTSALDLRGELLSAMKANNLRLDLRFLINKSPDVLPARDLRGIQFLEPLPFDRGLHFRFVKNARELACRGFKGTRYRRYVGLIVRSILDLSAPGPTAADYIARNRVARNVVRILFYGVIFSGMVVGAIALAALAVRLYYGPFVLF